MRISRNERYLMTQRLLSVALEHLSVLKTGASSVELIALRASSDAAENAHGMVARTADLGLTTLRDARRMGVVR